MEGCGLSSYFDVANEKRSNTVGKEIARRRKERSLTQAAMAKELERYGLKLQQAALGKWETGESVPNAYQLLALCHAFGIEDVLDVFCQAPELNKAGQKKLSGYRTDLIASGRYRPAKETLGTLEYIDMPVSLLPVSAGIGELLDENSFETVGFPASSVPAGAEFGVRVNGDSMEPVYHDGQIVWVRRCETLRPGEVGVVMYDGQGYLKAYGETKDGPALLSYNKKYAPIPIRPELEFRISGRVLN